MKLHYLSSRGKVDFNFFQIFFFIVLAFGVYASYKYYPIVKTRSTLLNILGEASFQAKRQDPEAVKAVIVQAAKRKANVIIEPSDITIYKPEGFVELRLKWRPIIDWGFGHMRRINMDLKKERAIY